MGSSGENMKFRSKVDWWAYICFASFSLISFWVLVEFIKQPTNVGLIIGVVVFALCNALILPWWWNMHYILGDNELVIKLGGFVA